MSRSLDVVVGMLDLSASIKIDPVVFPVPCSALLLQLSVVPRSARRTLPGLQGDINQWEADVVKDSSMSLFWWTSRIAVDSIQGIAVRKKRVISMRWEGMDWTKMMSSCRELFL